MQQVVCKVLQRLYACELKSSVGVGNERTKRVAIESNVAALP